MPRCSRRWTCSARRASASYSGGEYRRTGWSNVVRDAVEGLVPTEGSPIRGLPRRLAGAARDAGHLEHDHAGRGGAMVAGEKLRQVRRLVGTDAEFLKAHAPGPWKMTMPGRAVGRRPAVATRASATRSIRRRLDLAYDLVPMLRSEIAALNADGCAYMQLDSLHYVERVADTTIRARMIAEGEDPDAYLDDLIAIDNAVLAGVQSRRRHRRHAHVPRQQPQRLARRGQLRADRRKGVQPVEGRSLPARIRHRARRRLRAAALRARRQDGRAGADQLQGAELESVDTCAGGSTRPPSMSRWRTWPSPRSAASPRRTWATC